MSENTQEQVIEETQEQVIARLRADNARLLQDNQKKEREYQKLKAKNAELKGALPSDLQLFGYAPSAARADDFDVVCCTPVMDHAACLTTLAGHYATLLGQQADEADEAKLVSGEMLEQMVAAASNSAYWTDKDKERSRDSASSGNGRGGSVGSSAGAGEPCKKRRKYADAELPECQQPARELLAHWKSSAGSSAGSRVCYSIGSSAGSSIGSSAGYGVGSSAGYSIGSSESTDEQMEASEAIVRTCLGNALRALLQREKVEVDVAEEVGVIRGVADVVLQDQRTGSHLLAIEIAVNGFMKDCLPQVLAYAQNVACMQVAQDLRLVRARAADVKALSEGELARVAYVPHEPAFWEGGDEVKVRQELLQLRSLGLTYAVVYMDGQGKRCVAVLYYVTFVGSRPHVWKMWEEDTETTRAVEGWEATQGLLARLARQVVAIARLGERAVLGPPLREGRSSGIADNRWSTVLKMAKGELVAALGLMPGSEKLGEKVGRWEEEAVACKYFGKGEDEQRQYAVFGEALDDEEVAVVDVGRAVLVLCPWYEGQHRPSCVAHLVGLRMHLAKLHGKGYVHGDVRTVNVVFRQPPAGSEGRRCTAEEARGCVRLIDYDLAREVGQEYVPDFHDEVTDVERHPGAKANEAMETVHDLYATRDIFKLARGGDDAPWPRELSDTWAELFKENEQEAAVMAAGWAKEQWTEEPWSVLLKHGWEKLHGLRNRNNGKTGGSPKKDDW